MDQMDRNKLASLVNEIDAATSGPLETAKLRRKGHRLGVLLTILGPVLIILGILLSESVAWSGAAPLLLALGAVFLVFGYGLARLWFWFKQA